MISIDFRHSRHRCPGGSQVQLPTKNVGQVDQSAENRFEIHVKSPLHSPLH
jgi:hypothetical protein